MASITSVAFTAELRLNDPTPQLILTDTTDYAGQGITAPDAPAGIITASGPAGIFYNNTNFGAPDVPAPLTSPTSTITIPLPLDQNNNLLQGDYSVTYTVRVADLTQASDTTDKTINYADPVANVVMSVDLGAPLLTSDDQTGYTVDLITPSITRNHDIFYPASFNRDPIEGTAKIVTTNVILVVANQTVAYTSTLVSDLTYDYGDGITLTSQITGNGQLDITGNADICEVYCCLNAAYDRYLEQSVSDTRRAQETREQLELATSLTFLLFAAIRCGKTEDINGYVEQIRSVLSCTDDCECGDEPQLVVGVNGSTGTVTVVAGSGISVSSTSGGGTTEYTVSMEAALLSKLNSLFNTTAVAGTNITITSTTSAEGNIEYTINAASQIQSAPDVPITAIPGQIWDDVQEALVGIKGIADTNTTSISNLTASAIAVVAIAGVTGTEVQTVLESLKALIDGNTSAIAALTASDIATSPITGVTGTDVQAMLSSLKSLIDDTVTNTTTNTGNISTNATNISTNTTNIGNNTTAIADLQPESWTVVDNFTSGWNNDPNASLLPLQYRRDPWGMLHITGGLRNSGTPASTSIFVLPVGYRPTGDNYAIAYDDSGGATDFFAILINSSDGNVTFQGSVQANAELFINFTTRLT